LAKAGPERISIELIIFNQQQQVSEATEYKFPCLRQAVNVVRKS
jgi:hypothetical protein